jgi:hypothetical protein
VRPCSAVPKRRARCPPSHGEGGRAGKTWEEEGNIITIEFPDGAQEKMPEDLGRELG